MQQHTQRARGGKPYLHTASKCFPTHFLTPLHAWSVVTFHSLLSGGTRQRAPKRSATLLSATSPGSAAAAAGRESTLPAARRQRLPQPRSPHPGCTEPLPALQARATLLRGPQPRRCGRSAPRRARRGGHGRGVGASRRTAGRGAPRPSRNKAGPPPCRPRSLPTPRRRPRGRTGGIRPLAARPAADTAAGQPCSRLRLPPPRPQNGAGTGGAPPRRDGGSRRTETPRHRHRHRLASLPARLSLSPSPNPRRPLRSPGRAAPLPPAAQRGGRAADGGGARGLLAPHFLVPAAAARRRRRGPRRETDISFEPAVEPVTNHWPEPGTNLQCGPGWLPPQIGCLVGQKMAAKEPVPARSPASRSRPALPPRRLPATRAGSSPQRAPSLRAAAAAFPALPASFMGTEAAGAGRGGAPGKRGLSPAVQDCRCCCLLGCWWRLLTACLGCPTPALGSSVERKINHVPPR